MEGTVQTQDREPTEGKEHDPLDTELDSFFAELAADVARGNLTERQALALLDGLGLPDDYGGQ
jgi:hypothetical protein